jgi:hypothetical protein
MSGWAKLRALAFSIGGAAIFLLGCEHQKHPWGKRTRDSFGDGRFQIVRVARPPNLLLFDCERKDPVVEHVKNWAKRSVYVFVVDDAGKCWKVDYRTGVVVSFETTDAAGTEDRELFEKLLKGLGVRP